jgi:protein disulfide-isomerase A6
VGLPHISESGAQGRDKYKQTVASVAKAFRSSPAFSFLWFQGTSQPALEGALELTFGFPAVVALSMDRKAYAVMRGSFSEKGMTSFLHSLTTGRQATLPLQSLPSVVTVEAWDGKDAAPTEEEFSLDDIMGEEL